MIIRLNEIPSEGKSFDFSHKSGELNDVLNDLIGDNDYKVHLEVTPMGNTFDISGRIQSCYNEICSFCASDFKLPIEEKFHELVVKDDQKDLKGFDEGWSPHDNVGVTAVGDPNQYNVSDLIHEVLALSEPTQPICKTDCKGLCASCGQDLNEGTCDCASSQSEKPSPFSILKKLKLN